MLNIMWNFKKNKSYYHHVLWSLVSGRLTPSIIWHSRYYRLKFLIRFLSNYTSTIRMFNNLTSRPSFDQLLSVQPTLPCKPHRPYLMRGLHVSKRVDAIINHYQYIDGLTSKNLANALESTEPKMVATFSGKANTQFYIYSTCAIKSEREGESTLRLHDEDYRLLASITFCVINKNSQYSIIIGGVQGPRNSVSHDVIKRATRDCHGLFPKRILMEVIWKISAHTDIKSIYGVSDNGHVFRSFRYRLKKNKYFHASYDEFWALIGGEEHNKFLWELPMGIPRKSIDDIASKKRAEYRRRFQLLDDIAMSIKKMWS